jgi:hypothetical protein
VSCLSLSLYRLIINNKLLVGLTLSFMVIEPSLWLYFFHVCVSNRDTSGHLHCDLVWRCVYFSRVLWRSVEKPTVFFLIRSWSSSTSNTTRWHFYTFTNTHSPLPLTNVSPPIHFPFLRYPLPPIHLVFVRIHHPQLQLFVFDNFHIFHPRSRFISYNNQTNHHPSNFLGNIYRDCSLEELLSTMGCIVDVNQTLPGGTSGVTVGGGGGVRNWLFVWISRWW